MFLLCLLLFMVIGLYDDLLVVSMIICDITSACMLLCDGCVWSCDCFIDAVYCMCCHKKISLPVMFAASGVIVSMML